MAHFDHVPVVEVNKENFVEMWPSMVLAIQASSFIGVDCELSGLGSRPKLNARDIGERYKNIVEVARTHAIISLGLSCFKHKPRKKQVRPGTKARVWKYLVHTYNIVVLCTEDYLVEPKAVNFLVEHGFDFNKQYSKGVPYYRGNDKPEKKPTWTLRDLFSQILESKKSLVVHNGFIDLIFLYQNLYAELPPKLETFVADLCDMFPAGIYDTKYMADYVVRTPASYLEYVFRREQKMNAQKRDSKLPHVKVSFPDFTYCESYVEIRPCGLPEVPTNLGTNVKLCPTYANHGYCRSGSECPLSHDIDLVLSEERKNENHQKRRRRKRNFNSENGSMSSCESEMVNTSQNACAELPVDNSTNGNTESGAEAKPYGSKFSHRAGFDAFMTTFALVCYLVHNTSMPPKPTSYNAVDIATGHLINKIYLYGKPSPLLIQRSSFAKLSKNHLDKRERGTNGTEVTEDKMETEADKSVKNM